MYIIYSKVYIVLCNWYFKEGLLKEIVVVCD